MRTMPLLVCLLALTALSSQAAASVPTPQVLLQRVQATYLKAGDIKGTFTQTTIGKLRGKAQTESGRLWAKKDGRVRWRYEQPIQKEFVYDGKTAFFYEPANAQVTRFEKFSESKLGAAIDFLIGRGDFAKNFDVKTCTNFCDAGEPDSQVLTLWPKKPLGHIDHVLLFVDPKSYRVRSSMVFDTLENRTEYRFTELTFGAQVKDRTFDFRVPDVVQELRAQF